MSGLSILTDTLGIKKIILSYIEGFKTFLYSFFTAIRKGDTCFIPNETTLLSTNKSYFDILPKDEWKVKMIAHWKLLENMSHKKEENFYLHVPSEEAVEFRYLIEQHEIKAIVCATSIAA